MSNAKTTQWFYIPRDITPRKLGCHGNNKLLF